MTFQISDPFSPEQWDRVDRAALDILQKVGLKVQHAPTLDSFEPRRAYALRASWSSLSRQQSPTKSGNWRLGDYDTAVIAGAYSHLFMDPKSDRSPHTQVGGSCQLHCGKPMR